MHALQPSGSLPLSECIAQQFCCPSADLYSFQVLYILILYLSPPYRPISLYRSCFSAKNSFHTADVIDDSCGLTSFPLSTHHPSLPSNVLHPTVPPNFSTFSSVRADRHHRHVYGFKGRNLLKGKSSSNDVNSAEDQICDILILLRSAPHFSGIPTLALSYPAGLVFSYPLLSVM